MSSTSVTTLLPGQQDGVAAMMAQHDQARQQQQQIGSASNSFLSAQTTTSDSSNSLTSDATSSPNSTDFSPQINAAVAPGGTDPSQAAPIQIRSHSISSNAGTIESCAGELEIGTVSALEIVEASSSSPIIVEFQEIASEGSAFELAGTRDNSQTAAALAGVANALDAPSLREIDTPREQTIAPDSADNNNGAEQPPQQQQRPQLITCSGSVDNILLATTGPQLVATELQQVPSLICNDSKSNTALDCAGEQQALQVQHQSNQSNKTASSSRFFSSKLNTGSLWSLLSVGSNNSSSGNTQGPPEAEEQIDAADQLIDQRGLLESGKQQVADLGGKSSGFFGRVQFKRPQQQSAQQQQQQIAAASSTPLRQDNQTSLMNNASPSLSGPSGRPRFRFNVRYFGSTILHKNFTLPMLEWIAKDVRRQTVKGAQSTSQRQFTMPMRDIIFEIQSSQITAISCKDGHCIFVHSMQCVSKYAQLQYDPTCFSYLIRDNKDSPYFCHVFQAKSANKVHDIFSAIREATTGRSLPLGQPLQSSMNAGNNMMIGLQKSASTDCGPRKSLFGDKSLSLFSPFPSTSPSGVAPASSARTNQAVPMYPVPDSLANKPANIRPTTAQAESSAQFENSYQFEVLFVKKVKLQCRRVPATFVDDALETLRSYEVLKGGDHHAKASKGLGKRIISASVDERQEYDEAACQSPTASSTAPAIQAPYRVGQNELTQQQESDEQRRGSSCSLISRNMTTKDDTESGRESRSCQQSPVKTGATGRSSLDGSEDSKLEIFDTDQTRCTSSRQESASKKQHHQSMDNLIVRGPIDAKDVPNYTNDFSPYNTITSSDLNERIAAIPVVSSSVSLDQETRQRLARRVRETIMATAANIKKDVYASGDKLDSSSSSKALDSLSCTVAAPIPPPDESQNPPWSPSAEGDMNEEETAKTTTQLEQRRSSAGISMLHQQSPPTSNNFDLFRRASARQVIKNRTMLLLIGRDELCTISIDKHQMLFSKSFNSIVHCLQGSNNKDHFGLICRDSGKINPQTESYAGFVFKCQSEKVVREIMGALKQVIYNSQHNYHGFDSPYNPLNSLVAGNPYSSQPQHSPKMEIGQPYSVGESPNSGELSLAAKRGFTNSVEVEKAARSNRNSMLHSKSIDPCAASAQPFGSPPTTVAAPMSALPNFANSSTISFTQKSNPIKSMFCDSCPLYWYHRLCIDIESLPAESSKTIILRRIDSSLTDKEQDEVYSRFSDFQIDSVAEHNEIFMSILRHQCERKQLKHNQSQAHLSAIAKNAALVKQPSIVGSILSRQSSNVSNKTGNDSSRAGEPSRSAYSGHRRSGSSSGSLAQIIGTQMNDNVNQMGIADAGSAAMDNLIRAKNSISVSIENMLKRRASTKDETCVDGDRTLQINLSSDYNKGPLRSGSFKTSSREPRAIKLASSNENSDGSTNDNPLKRSQSTSVYNNSTSSSTWRESLSRTINDDNPIVGLFRRRSSTFGDGSSGNKNRKTAQDPNELLEHQNNLDHSSSTSTIVGHLPSQPSSPNIQESRFHFPSNKPANKQQSSGSSPSSVLSGAFWKKSIFDKIRQPEAAVPSDRSSGPSKPGASPSSAQTAQVTPRKRSREELRTLWKKAIIEQMTLIKMDRQNQQLQSVNKSNKDSRSPSGGNTCTSQALPDGIQDLKLNYKDVIYSRDALKSWQTLLKQDPTQKVDFVEVVRHVRLGVPKQTRGEVWMFLMNQYQLRHGTSFQPTDNEFIGDANQTYRNLLSQLSVQQHEIFVDIGRTFPSHPYYSQYLSIGQLSLFNLLKAYSLLDQEVGYCQGLSFVAGILLLHVDSEDEAFELMRHLMFNFGLRKQYLPSMNALHLQLYQMTRLLRDHDYDLFNHFDRYDISPSLYAAPWFLTLFASQFPLGFVARLLDLIYLIGIEAIFRLSLNLLTYHRSSILGCSSLESTMEFMKTNLVDISDKNLVKIFDMSLSMDLRNKLIDYEIEYTFYCAEDRARLGHNSSMIQNPSTLMTNSRQKSTSTSSKTQSSSSKNDGCNNSANKIKQDAIYSEPSAHEGESHQETKEAKRDDDDSESTSVVANATATIIIQHLLANNHLKSLRNNYTY